jgi:predicted RNA-binding Zn-ribbon protein involved in translation (DUF1610 family)
MSHETCPRCERARSENDYICPTCVTEAARDLNQAAYYLKHIDDKRARRGSRLWTGGGRASAEQPLPYDPRVRHVAEPARRNLTRWAELVIREHGCTNLPNQEDTDRIDRLTRVSRTWDAIAARDDLTDDQAIGARTFAAAARDDLAYARLNIDLRNLANVAVWISTHLEWIATRPYAHDIADQAHTMFEKLDHLFDNPPETIALGTCGTVHDTPDGRIVCDHILAAPIEKDHYPCPRCGEVHDVASRRRKLLERADDLSVTIADATRLLRIAGTDVSRQKVHRIVTEAGLQATSVVTTGGRPANRYPLGKVRDVVEQYNLSTNRHRNVGTMDKESATLSA